MSYAKQYSQIQIRKTRFRTQESEKNLQTQDSGICSTLLNAKGTQSSLKFGVLQQILEVNFAGNKVTMLRVNFYKHSKKNTKIAGSHWVLTGGNDVFEALPNAFIAAEKVDGQVFFAKDPERQDALACFSYKGSTFSSPSHHFDEEGRMLAL